MARLIKELGQINDPELKEAARSRRKALKAVLQALQNPSSSADDKTQLLTKTLIAQVLIMSYSGTGHIADKTVVDHFQSPFSSPETIELRTKLSVLRESTVAAEAYLHSRQCHNKEAER